MNLKKGLAIFFFILSLVLIVLIEKFFPESEGLSFVAGFLIAFSLILLIKNVIRR